MDLKVFLETENSKLFKRATALSAGYDIYCSEDFSLAPGELHMVKTGIRTKMPEDLCALILPRSSLAAKYGIIVSSSGLIDADYEGEWLVPLYRLPIVKHSDKNIQKDIDIWDEAGKTEDIFFKTGSRIAQVIFLNYNSFDNIEQLKEWSLKSGNQRTGGFGSTGD